MLRKLIVLAITSGLAKKAWDKYQQKNAGMASAGTGPARTGAKPGVGARTSGTRPDAS